MAQDVKGTFTCAEGANPGQLSPDLLIPTGCTSMKLSLAGDIDANNTCKTQKSTDNGNSWADQTTYNSAQPLVGVVVADGERWRLVQVSQQAGKDVRYALSALS